MKCLIALAYLLVEWGIHLYTVGLHQQACGFIVPFALDALHLGQQCAEGGTEGRVVGDLHIGLSFPLHHFGSFRRMGQCPSGDERPVAHVGFFYLVARLNADKLGYQSVHHVGVILCLIGFLAGKQAQLQHLLVGDIVEAEQVGTCFFDGAAVSLQRVRVHAGSQPSASVPQTFVKVGMEAVAAGIVLGDHLQCGLVYDKLLEHAAGLGCFVVGMDEVADGDALAAMLATNPVAVGEIDAYGTAGVQVAAQHGSCDHAGRHAFAHGLPVGRVDGRMVFKPLCVVAQFLCPGAGLGIREISIAFPTGLQSQRVAIHFGETVHEIHLAGCVGHPFDGIAVEGVQVARAVETDECADDGLLLLVLGVGEGGLQHPDDVVNGLPVQSSAAIGVLGQPAVGPSHKPAVHAMHDGSVRVAVFFLSGVELLGLLLCDAFLVVVTGRGEQQVLPVGLVHTLGQDVGREDDGAERIQQMGHRLPLC